MHDRQTRAKKEKKSWIRTALDVLIIVCVAVLTFAVFKLTSVKSENQEKNNPDVVEGNNDDDEDDGKINLNPVIGAWMSSTMKDTKQAVAIYDLDNDKMVGELNINETFPMESLYKLPVVFEGYKRVDNGSLDGDAESAGGHTVRQCLDLAIRESNSACAEDILAKLGGEAQMDAIVQRDWGLQKTSISNLETTADDMIRMLKRVFEHKDLSQTSWKQLQDSMLNQPPVENQELCNGACDFRQGLPAGFTQGTKVYDKVGWRLNGTMWMSYNDTALLEFPDDNRNFAIVILTQLYASSDKISELGKLTEEAILAYLRYE